MNENYHHNQQQVVSHKVTENARSRNSIKKQGKNKVADLVYATVGRMIGRTNSGKRGQNDEFGEQDLFFGE